MKIRKITGSAIFLLCICFFGCKQEAKTSDSNVSENRDIASTPDGWISLFNGKNLEGWTLFPQDSSYTGKITDLFGVEDNMIHVYPTQKKNSKQTHAAILTRSNYSNYILRLEYRWGLKKFKPRQDYVRDAGVMFHVNGEGVFWPDGIECQIQEGDTGDLWIIGSQASTKVKKGTRTYDPNGILATLGETERYNRFHREYSWEVEGWNQLEIEVKNDYASFRVNGHLVNEAIDMKYLNKNQNEWKPLTAGKILLQAEGSELYYRNILLKQL